LSSIATACGASHQRRPFFCFPCQGDLCISPDSEVEGSLIPDSFVFLQDSSLRFRSVQNDKQVVVILSDVVVILSDSEESRINFGIRVN
jgi:hypothetical protein